MTQRIPGGVPIHTWVDRLIHEARERGEFDNLPGAGKPLPGLDEPVHEDWWVHQKIREEEVPAHVLLPPALQLRKEIAELPEVVRDLPDEESVRAAVHELNRRVAEWIRAPSGPVLPVGRADVEEVVTGWRTARSRTAPATPDDDAASGGQGGAPGDEPAEVPQPRRAPWWRRILRRERRT
ncbi:DUF1992 domain-containing protein [Pseudactinotalea sp. Z1732]|uniref:DnaJ family domain-containing protein n=1 Tax=Pseudactinotalea sp. Z1732 TaxID=3413026 RepID=UPI003C7DACAB